MNRQELGRQGEALALKFLQKKGYQILETNFHKRIGEIDIIAKNPENQYIFIEVKTRRGNTFGYPEESVTALKMSKMRRTAELWLMSKKITTDNIRLDVISIELTPSIREPRITHLENCA